MEVLLILGALALVSVGLIVGYLCANHSVPGRHRALGRREALQRAESEALLTAQRLNAAFMAARRAMWEEASRHRREPDSSAGL